MGREDLLNLGMPPPGRRAAPFRVERDILISVESARSAWSLLTNIADFGADEIVARYKNLADIERGFRVLKSDPEI